jgi:hypothetical protein
MMGRSFSSHIASTTPWSNAPAIVLTPTIAVGRSVRTASSSVAQ